MKNKAFRNLFCNPQKNFHTSPSRNFFLVNAIFEFEEWLTASFIRVGGVKTLLWITE